MKADWHNNNTIWLITLARVHACTCIIVIILLQYICGGAVQYMLWAYNVTKWRKGIAKELVGLANSKAIGLVIASDIATLEFVQEFLTECQLQPRVSTCTCTCIVHVHVCVRACVQVSP